MKKVKKVSNQVFQYTKDSAFAVLTMGALVFLYMGILKVLTPLWPVTTIIFVLVATACGITMRSGVNSAVTISGLAIYVASWVIHNNGTGDTLSQAICCLGIVMWMIGITYTKTPARTGV